MASEVMENIKPTRMELLKLRKKTALAEKGHKLLGEKRDALVVEFLKIIKERAKVRRSVNADLADSYLSLSKVKMTMGENSLNEALKGIPPLEGINLNHLNIMGVKVPKLAWNPGDRFGINYSLIDTNAYMDEAVDDFNKVMGNLFHLAEIEGSIERLAVEIEKTKRRVNALEYIFLPRLKATQKYIEMRLQEREREDFFRRKKIKSIMERQRAEEERLLGESLV